MTIAIIVVILSTTLYCSISDSDSTKRAYTMKSILQIMTGFSFVSQSQEFTEDYIKFVNGVNTNYKVSPALTIYYKLDFSKKLRPCILFDYSTASLNDDYTQNYQQFGKTISRSIAEQINVAVAQALGHCFNEISGINVDFTG